VRPRRVAVHLPTDIPVVRVQVVDQARPLRPSAPHSTARRPSRSRMRTGLLPPPTTGTQMLRSFRKSWRYQPVTSPFRLHTTSPLRFVSWYEP
jgi:hypothetical protein